MDATIVSQKAPHTAASLSSEYPQFTSVQLPIGSTAESAWIGEIQPFASDDSARTFLHEIEAGKPIWLVGGRIQEAPPSKTHWADVMLTNMSLRCKLLVLIQPTPAHPRAYLLRPLFAEHYSYVHPHPRSDQQIEWDNRKIPGLCIYSASEFKYDPHRERNAQFLDQVTLYIARHLIWLRTRQLFRGTPPNGIVLRMLLPGDMLFNDKPAIVQPGIGDRKPVLDYWAGYWPGPTALAFNAATHLKSIRSHHQCWCGSGIAYQDCHRLADQKLSVQP